MTTSHDWPPELDALIAAPDHHRVLLENAHVRVLDTRIGAGERTAVHTHRWPAVHHVLAWSEFVRRDAAGAVLVDTRTGGSVSPGAALWGAPLGPHSLENVGAGPLHIISVEVKGAEPAPEGAGFRANNEIAVHVADPAAAAAFHAGVLGGEVVERTADCIEVASGALRLFLLRDPAPTHDRVVPSFDVPDRAAALERLRSAGCSFVPIGPHAPDGVYVRDPSGVIFDVIERPAMRPERE